MAQITGGSSGGSSGQEIRLPVGVENGVVAFVDGQYICTDAADLKSSSVECTGDVSSSSMTSENLYVQNKEGTAGVVADETGISVTNTETGKNVFYSEDGITTQSTTMTSAHIKAVADANPTTQNPLVTSNDSRLSIPDATASTKGLMTTTQVSKLDGIGGSISTGTQASRPSAGTANRLYVPTDGYPLSIDNGSSWDPVVDGRRYSAPPAPASLTQIGFTSDTTLTQHGDALLFIWTGDSDGSSKNIGAVVAKPAGNYSLTIGFELLAMSLTNQGAAFGLIVTDGTASNSKAFTIGLWLTSTTLPYFMFYTQNVTLPGTWSATRTNVAWPFLNYFSHQFFIKLTDDGTNHVVTLSLDGVNWNLLSSTSTISRTDWLTPAYIGLFAGHGAASVVSPAKRIQTRIFHWRID